MPKKLYNAKYFRNLMLVVGFLWSIITLSFFIYQIQNENNHLKNKTLQRIKNIAVESKSLVYWAYDQKIKSKNINNNKINPISGFSIRDMLKNIVKNEKIDFDINLAYDEDDLNGLDNKIRQLIRKVQGTKKDDFVIYKSGKKEFVYYMTALIANKTCISCHIHSEDRLNSTIGSITITKEFPSFMHENGKRAYFFIFSYTFTWLFGLFGIWWFYKGGINFLNAKVRNFETNIYSLVEIMEKRDRYTAGHSRRVAEYSKLIAQKLWCNKEEIELVYRAAMLHDIGKIEIPDAILVKPDKLTDKEYEYIKKHPQTGYELLNKEPFKELANIVWCHHERYDGNGYPRGLNGKEIPLLSRIISVADTFDALTTNRAYRDAVSTKKAIDIICKESGKQFDPKVIYAAKEILLVQKPSFSISQLPKNKLEEFKFSYYFKDQLTGVYNLNYINFLIKHKFYNNNQYMLHLYFKDFDFYNKEYGWKKGNDFLVQIANKLNSIFNNADIIRIAGDNFLIIGEDKKIYHNGCQKIKSIFANSKLSAKCKEFTIDKNSKITYEAFEKYFTI